MCEILTPATAKGYSHVARNPCVFSNNLWKAACMLKQISSNIIQYVSVTKSAMTLEFKELDFA
jgi:hypothetical protein